MSSNPLEDDPEREHRIRDRAYHLWESEGRPHGHDADLWERARELIGMEESAGSGQLPNPASTGQDPLQDQPVEEAFLQENLGEFPSRFADQGEAQPTPIARHDSRPFAEAPERQPAARPSKSPQDAPETLPGKPSLKAKALQQAEGKPPARKKPAASAPASPPKRRK